MKLLPERVLYGNKVVRAVMVLQKFLSRKKLSRKYRSIFVSKISPATGVTPVAGLIFETKNRAIFSGELFSGEEFLEQHYCPYNFVLWSGFIFPELEHL